MKNIAIILATMLVPGCVISRLSEPVWNAGKKEVVWKKESLPLKVAVKEGPQEMRDIVFDAVDDINGWVGCDVLAVAKPSQEYPDIVIRDDMVPRNPKATSTSVVVRSAFRQRAELWVHKYFDSFHLYVLYLYGLGNALGLADDPYLGFATPAPGRRRRASLSLRKPSIMYPVSKFDRLGQSSVSFKNSPMMTEADQEALHKRYCSK